MSALQEEFAQSVAKLLQKAAELGYGVTFGEAWRTPEQAQWNADHHLGVAHSLHMERLAIDINLFKDGAYLTTEDAYKELGEWWKSMKSPVPGAIYRWGGDIAHLADANHFSISPDSVRI